MGPLAWTPADFFLALRTCCAYPRSEYSLVLYGRTDRAIRTIRPYGFSREIEPEALARLVGWSMTLKALALRLRCSNCGKKAAQVVAVTRPRPRGIPKNLP